MDSKRFCFPVALMAALAGVASCAAPPEEPAQAERPRPIPKASAAASGLVATPALSARAAASAAPASPTTKPVASVTPSPDDPLKGVFGLEDATKGLPAGGQLIATIETSVGKLSCTLFDDKAPITVANFVGLARGLRPFKGKDGKWAKKAAYDGTTFHRIIKGFMIQGGDPLGTGGGEPGYTIPDEVWPGSSHDRAGLLCMANRGPNTNGQQFFITDDAAPHLDYHPRRAPSGYTIFGECSPVSTVHDLASVKTTGERPDKPPTIDKITITRRKSAAGSASGAPGAGSAPAPPASAKPKK